MISTYIKFSLFTLIFSFCCIAGIQAQKVLQVEKRNSPKTVKYYIGDDLIYKIEDDNRWRKEEILEISVQDNTFTVASGIIHTDHLTYIIPQSTHKIQSFIKNIIGNFGLTVLFYSVAELLVVSSYNWLAFYVGVTAVGIAAASYVIVPWIMQKKIGNQYRVRLLDLSFR